MQSSGSVRRPKPALDVPSSTTMTSPGRRTFCIAFQYASWVRGASDGTKDDCFDGRAGCFFGRMLEDGNYRLEELRNIHRLIILICRIDIAGMKVDGRSGQFVSEETSRRF